MSATPPTPAPIIILNGASSAGKSTLLRELQNILPHPYLDAGLDRFLWMLPPRYLKEPLWDQVLGQADHAGPVGQRLVYGMHHAIAALSRAGNPVLAEHVLIHRHWLRHCAVLFHTLPAYLIAVHCPLSVLEQREKDRGDRTFGQARKQFHLVHAYARYDFEVDTAACSPPECAARIAAFLQTNPPPTAFAALYQNLSE